MIFGIREQNVIVGVIDYSDSNLKNFSFNTLHNSEFFLTLKYGSFCCCKCKKCDHNNYGTCFDGTY